MFKFRTMLGLLAIAVAPTILMGQNLNDVNFEISENDGYPGLPGEIPNPVVRFEGPVKALVEKQLYFAKTWQRYPGEKITVDSCKIDWYENGQQFTFKGVGNKVTVKYPENKATSVGVSYRVYYTAGIDGGPAGPAAPTVKSRAGVLRKGVSTQGDVIYSWQVLYNYDIIPYKPVPMKLSLQNLPGMLPPFDGQNIVAATTYPLKFVKDTNAYPPSATANLTVDSSVVKVRNINNPSEIYSFKGVGANILINYPKNVATQTSVTYTVYYTEITQSTNPNGCMVVNKYFTNQGDLPLRWNVSKNANIGAPSIVRVNNYLAGVGKNLTLKVNFNNTPNISSVKAVVLSGVYAGMELPMNQVGFSDLYSCTFNAVNVANKGSVKIVTTDNNGTVNHSLAYPLAWVGGNDVVDNFSDSIAVKPTWTNQSGFPFQLTNEGAMVSQYITGSGYSDMVTNVTLTEAKQLYFDLKTDVVGQGSYAAVYLDNRYLKHWTTTSPWTRVGPLSVPMGKHKIAIFYSQSNSTNGQGNMAIDNFWLTSNTAQNAPAIKDPSKALLSSSVGTKSI